MSIKNKRFSQAALIFAEILFCVFISAAQDADINFKIISPAVVQEIFKARGKTMVVHAISGRL
jgi:hypothetical protein